MVSLPIGKIHYSQARRTVLNYTSGAVSPACV